MASPNGFPKKDVSDSQEAREDVKKSKRQRGITVDVSTQQRLRR